MHGHQLPLETVLHLLDDAKEAGLSWIRFYAGEPLVHRDLPKMVEHATRLGLKFWITTNGLLFLRRIDELYAVGARDFTLGYYGGSPATYDKYVQGAGAHGRVEKGVAYTRQVYGDAVRLGLDWVLMRPTCSLGAVSHLGDLRAGIDCHVTIKLGNLHENRLRNFLFTPTHRKAAIDAYKLDCPNCNCGFENRILAHGPGRRLYS